MSPSRSRSRSFAVASVAVAIASGAGCPREEPTCTVRLVARTPAPSPLAEEGDVAHLVIAREERLLFDDVVDLFGAGQAGGEVTVLSPAASSPVVPAGSGLTVSLTVFSSLTNDAVAVGRARFDCDADGEVPVPIWLGPANAFAPAAPIPGARAGAAAVALLDGRVLVVGGGGPPGSAMAGAALFDPGSGAWCTDCITSAPPPRAEHTATLLEDGSVLVVGGVHEDGTLAETALLFDPIAAAFTTVGTLAVRAHGAARASASEVIVLGGLDAGGAALGEAVFVGADGAVRTSAASLQTPRAFPATALLASGKVLAAGGEDAAGAPLDSIELFDIESETFAGPLLPCPTAPGAENLCARRTRAAIVILDDGNALLWGGITEALGAEPAPAGEVFLVSDERALPAVTAGPAALDGASLLRLACAAPPCPTLVVPGAGAPHALFAIASAPPALGDDAYGGTLATAARSALVARAGVALAALSDGTALAVGGLDEGGNARADSALFSPCEATASAPFECPPP